MWQRMDRGARDGRGGGGGADFQPNQGDNRYKDEGTGDVEAQHGDINWDRAANLKPMNELPPLDPNAKENGRRGPDLGKNKDMPESSKEAERREPGLRDDRSDDRATQTGAREEAGGCKFCGLRNHKSEDCKRKVQCEICGYHNHNTYECRREPLWNACPELCAAQVMDQSFFYIDEIVDPRASSEKSSTIIVTVIKGEASGKQIEAEFKNTVSSKVWRWTTRKLAENKYAIRFPDAQLVHVYSNFTFLGMKEADAQIKVEPWKASVGAKGELQQAWFKVRGIPTDQRSVKTIAKVGGLVGKTVAIDEKTKFRPDFVRIKIACRDINLVPESAESSLGMFLYDFFFEREIPDEIPHEANKAGVRIDSQPNQPTPKKPRTDWTPNVTPGGKDKERSTNVSDKSLPNQKRATTHYSAPAKYQSPAKQRQHQL